MLNIVTAIYYNWKFIKINKTEIIFANKHSSKRCFKSEEFSFTAQNYFTRSGVFPSFSLAFTKPFWAAFVFLPALTFKYKRNIPNKIDENCSHRNQPNLNWSTSSKDWPVIDEDVTNFQMRRLCPPTSLMEGELGIS